MKLSRRNFLKGLGALGATGFSALLSSHHGSKLLSEPERAQVVRLGEECGIIRPQWQGVQLVSSAVFVPDWALADDSYLITIRNKAGIVSAKIGPWALQDAALFANQDTVLSFQSHDGALFWKRRVRASGFDVEMIKANGKQFCSIELELID